MSYRILIVGAAFVNKGAEAMIRCVQRGILSRIPDAQGLLDASSGAEWTPRELRGLQPRVGLNAMRPRRVATTVVSCLSRLAPRRARLSWLKAASGVDLDIDAVVDISGYGVGDPWIGKPTGGWGVRARSRLAGMLLTDHELLTAADVPFIYLPQCWGPFEKPAARALADERLRTASRLYARDRTSLEWLRSLPSFQPDRVSLASDIAFTFEGDPPETGRKLLTDLGVRLDRMPLVGIVPNMRVYERVAGRGLNNVYVRELVAVASHFAADLGCQVVVMPHEIKTLPSSVPDDRYLCKLVADAASDAGMVRAALGGYTAEELKSMIGQTELIVSSRFHSIVAAMSLRVPVVSIAWSHKYRELLESVGLGTYVVEHENLADSSLVDLCDQAWTERVASVALLEQHVPVHEASARAVLEDTAAFIRECVLAR